MSEHELPLEEEQPEAGATGNGRQLFLFLGGMTVLGFLAALLIFGGEILAPSAAEPSEVAADFALQTPEVKQIVPEGVSQVQVGDRAPDFGLTDLDGELHQLSDFRGQPIIVNFWASWCAPCVIEMPELQAIYEERAEEGLVILAVNRQEDPETVQSFFYERMGLSFTPLLDERAAVAESYGVFNMPSTFFVNGAGEVTVVHRGPMTVGQIEDYLAQTVN